MKMIQVLHGRLAQKRLNSKLKGIRVGEIVTITAGSGTGKSQVCREIGYDLIRQGNTIGYVALEESVGRSARGLLSIPLNTLLHLPEERKKISEKNLIIFFSFKIFSASEVGVPVDKQIYELLFIEFIKL